MFKKAVIAYMALNFLEKEEEKKMKNLFYKLSNGNNKQIDEENFAKTLREVNDTYSDEEIKDLFNKLDENKNGVLEYEEIVRGFSDREKLFSEKNMKEAFNFVDKDKDGIINLEDISQVVFQNKKMPQNLMKQLLEEIEQKDDKNDVNITFEDFCKIMKNE
jgi:Ca2+-binding EF-hand superfamily protein